MSEHMQQGWHLNKNLTATHIFATLGVAFSAVVFAVQLESAVNVSAANISTNAADIKRIETIQADSKANTAAIQQMQKQQGVQYKEIIRRLERITDKLDTKADK